METNDSKIRHIIPDVATDISSGAAYTNRSPTANQRPWIYAISVPLLLISGYIICIYLPPDVVGSYAAGVANSIDSTVLLYILAGVTAQLIDGALGMGYGVTATTFLLSFGISPVASSASVHASEVFTSGASGLMHLKFGNVNAKLFKSLLVPGVLGAVLGAYVLSSFSKYTYIITPIISFYTLILGMIIISKALTAKRKKGQVTKIIPLALAGGFLDSIGGGGWGPIVSSTLIARGRNPKYTIGSVNLAEFFIALASSLTFITLIGLHHWTIIIGLIIGGVIAAPVAAMVSNKLPTKFFMIVVGLAIIIISLQRILF